MADRNGMNVGHNKGLLDSTAMQNRQDLVAIYLSAAQRGDVNVLRQLLDVNKGSSFISLLTASDENGSTALHFAADNGQLAAIRYIVEMNIDIDLRDNNAMNAMQRAAKFENSRASISPIKHMLTFLWFAGHQAASYRDVADRFDLSLSTLHAIITRVSGFLSSMAAEVIRWPSPESKQRTMEFYREKKGVPHVIGSIDGTHIKIDKPSERAADYFNRKDYYSMNVQGICDENLKFIDIFLGYPGSVHDARVFQNCTLWGNLENLCQGCYLLGDSAYPLLSFLLTPYRDNGHLTAAQRHFNTKLSSCRISIEHAFGVLKQRFRQLYHLKLRGHARICHFIRACCVLHNIADNDDVALFVGEVILEDIQPDHTEYQELRAIGRNIRNEVCQELFMMR